MFIKTELNKWIKNGKIVDRKKENINFSKSLKVLYETKFSLSKVRNILFFMSKIKSLKPLRKELLNSLLTALSLAENEKKSTYEAMKIHRNNIRMVGRKVYGRNLGTTLLTKGLEFENVVIIDAHKFKSKEHFYVAITRASKNLIIFSKSNSLKFDNHQ